MLSLMWQKFLMVTTRVVQYYANMTGYLNYFFLFPNIKAIQLKEVAYGKLSSQSSVYGSDKSHNAVDGDLNTYMHTEQELSPYWMVDLGQIYQIKRIEIFNRRQGTSLTG